MPTADCLIAQADQALNPAVFGQLLGWQPALVLSKLGLSSQERAVMYPHSPARASLAFVQTPDFVPVEIMG